MSEALTRLVHVLWMEQDAAVLILDRTAVEQLGEALYDEVWNEAVSACSHAVLGPIAHAVEDAALGEYDGKAVAYPEGVRMALQLAHVRVTRMRRGLAPQREEHPDGQAQGAGTPDRPGSAPEPGGEPGQGGRVRPVVRAELGSDPAPAASDPAGSGD